MDVALHYVNYFIFIGPKSERRTRVKENGKKLSIWPYDYQLPNEKCKTTNVDKL